MFWQSDRDARTQRRVQRVVARIAVSLSVSCAIVARFSRNCSCCFNCASRCSSSFLDSRIRRCARSTNIAAVSSAFILLPYCSWCIGDSDACPKPGRFTFTMGWQFARDARAQRRVQRVAFTFAPENGAPKVTTSLPRMRDRRYFSNPDGFNFLKPITL